MENKIGVYTGENTHVNGFYVVSQGKVGLNRVKSLKYSYEEFKEVKEEKFSFFTDFLESKGIDIFEEVSMYNLSNVCIFQSLYYFLITNKSLNEFYIDGVEEYLFPKVRLVLAELIVLIFKNLGVSVYIASHSVEFIRALEVFSASHECADKLVMYLVAKNGNSRLFAEPIDKEEVDRVYKLFADVMQELEDLTY